MSDFNFSLTKKIPNCLGRAGVIHTPHGDIQTPAFITVGTKATVKALSPEQVRDLGAQAVLANTYHLYLEPGADIVAKAGGLHSFMNWPGPMFTDSGGFQVFSLGAAYDSGGISKFLGAEGEVFDPGAQKTKPAKIDDEGVSFRSPIDGSEHRFTPESSIQIQHKLGADIIFAFDECTAPTADHQYQKESLVRTHSWAERSLIEHKKLGGPQALFGIVQGGRFQDLREESAWVIGAMDFAGFGIGGSFEKKDIGTSVAWVNSILPEEKPRHLLGIGEPEDLFSGVENGCDTFDCVLPTRLGRNGAILTATGRLNINNTVFREDFTPLEKDCACYTCQHYTRAYLAHLFRAKEMFAGTLASIHNLHFLIHLADQIRQSILDDTFYIFRDKFLAGYNQKLD